MLNIFHVDDSPQDIALTKIHLSKMLPEAEFHTFTAATEVLQALEHTHCDVIISDYQMPVMNGMTLLKEIRRKYPDLPFVFFTGQGNEELAVEAFRSGADDYYAKEESFAHYQRLANCITRLSQAYQERKEYRKTRQNLDENRRLLQAVMNASPVGVALLKDREILWGSQPFYDKFGYSEEEVKNQNARILYFDDEEYLRVGNDYFRQLEERAFARVHAIHRKKDGTAMHTLNLVSPLDTTDLSKGYIVAINDISDLKSAEEQLEFQANLLDSVEQAVIATDLEGKISYFNPSAEKLYRWNAAEVLGKEINQVTVPDISRKKYKEIMAKLEKGESWSGEFDVTDKNGRIFTASVTNSPFYDSDGRQVGIIGVSEDISHQIKVREKIQFQADLLESVEQVIIATDTEFRIQFFNAHAEYLYGWKREEVLGKNVNKLLIPRVLMDEGENIIKQLRNGQSWSGRFDLQRKDGSLVHITTTISPHYDEDGSLRGYIGISNDITEIIRTENELKAVGTRLDLALRSAQIAIWDYDLTTGTLSWDERMHELYDLSEQEFSEDYQGWQKRLHPDDLERASEEVELALAGTKDFNTQFRVVHRDGSIRHLRAFATITRDEDGVPQHMIGINYDITEARENEQRLLESEEKYRTLFDNAPVAIFQSDSQGSCLNANNELARILGYETPGEVVSNLTDVANQLYVDPQDRETIIETLRTTGKLKEFEFQARRADGSIVWLKQDARLIEQSESDDFLIEGFATDITLRKKAEEESRRSRLSFRNLIEHAAILGVALDQEGRISFINEYTLELTGWQRDEVMGTDWFDRFLPEEIRTQVRDVFAHTIKLQQVDDTHSKYVNDIITRSGEKLTISFTNAPILDSRNRLVGVTSIGIDITERIRWEKELEKMSADIKSVNEELEAFTYAVSHDLKAPVRQAEGFSRLLSDSLRKELQEEDARVLDLLQQTIFSMNEMLNDYLRISRTMNREITQERVDLSEIAEAVLTECAASEPGRQTEFIIESGLSASTDETLITSVLKNLLGNAWKYTEKTEKTVIEFGDRKENGARVYYVRDNGVGFDMKRAGLLFQPFKRLHDEEEFSGSGIGLTIAQRALRRLNGSIWAESEPGVQTTFYFTIGEENGSG
jgi:PAS domain S-box-containing protein